ncbi:hypothetical protein CDD82_7342 [Ophiocordyceps australis]|uniref:Rhodopsin domain-containing protein n=1 Tax=Ophiocordyceps australis TaxID=1399860 RepID=A0A2C5YMU1_9HYPO|nr:hypothetical protein CDD82_7342 [Ophiocordyceps australis]
MAASGMPAFPDPVNPDDPGRGPLLIGLIWTFSGLALIFVAVRFWVRIAVTKLLNVEDWLMLAAMIANIAGVACLTVSFYNGFGKHDTDLTSSQIVAIGKWMWMAYPPGIVCSILARTSIMILLVRIFGRNARLKWLLIAITILQVVVSLVLTSFIWAQVTPVEGMWNPLIPSKRRLPAHLVDRTGNVAGGLYAIGDLFYVLFPVIDIWKLNMPLRQKMGLCILLALSLVTMGTSIAKAAAGGVSSGINNTKDVLYNIAMSIFWASLEQVFVIMMGCAPPLRNVTKLRIPPASSISASFRGLKFASSRGTGYQMQDSNERDGSTDRIHSTEMVVKLADSVRVPDRGHEYEVYRL